MIQILSYFASFFGGSIEPIYPGVSWRRYDVQRQLQGSVLVLSCTILIFICGTNCGSRQAVSTLRQVSRQACRARFAKVGGGYQSLAPKPGFPKLYFVFASWSDHSRLVAPRVQQLFERYRSRGLHVVGVSLDHQSRVFAEAFTDVSGITFDVLRADGVLDSSLTACLGPTREVPKLILVDTNGNVIHHTAGPNANSSIDTLRSKIASTL